MKNLFAFEKKSSGKTVKLIAALLVSLVLVIQPVKVKADDELPGGNEPGISVTDTVEGTSSQGEGGQETPTDTEPPVEEQEGLPTEEQPAVTLTSVTGSEQPPALLGEGEPTDVTGYSAEAEEYSVPAGSVTILESDKTFTNGAGLDNAIQQALTDAVGYAAEHKSATIVVNDGTYEDGITGADTANNKTILEIISSLVTGSGLAEDEKITIKIVAHDAIDENGNYLATSAGNVIIDGDINFDGVNLVLAGLYFSTKASVNVSSAESFTYYGTALSDDVTINLTDVSESVYIDMGEGDDVAEVNVVQSPSIDIDVDTGFLNTIKNFDTTQIQEALASAKATEILSGSLTCLGDIVKLITDVAGSFRGSVNEKILDLKLFGGGGGDTLSLNLVNSTNFTTQAIGEGETAATLYSLDIDLSRVNGLIDGGSGADLISSSGGVTLKLGRAVAKVILEKISELAELPATTVEIRGAEGDDVFDIAMTSAFSSYSGVEYSFNGGAGFDRVSFSGKLQDTAGNIAGDLAKLTFKALAEITFYASGTDHGNSGELALSIPYKRNLSVSLSGVESYTDELENKRSYDYASLGSLTEAESFVNYTITDRSEIDADVVRRLVLPAGGVLLTNIYIKNSNPSESLKIKRLMAEGYNVLIESCNLTIDGAVSADNIIIKAVTSDKDNALFEVEAGVSDDLGDDTDVSFGYYPASCDAFVTITENAVLTASEAIDIAVKLIMDEGFFNLAALTGFNPFTLKIGESAISIAGTLSAGGYIKACAFIGIVIDASNGKLLSMVVPLAASVAISQSSIDLKGNASLTAGAGVCVGAKTYVNLVSETTLSALKLAVAVAVAVCDTHVKMADNAVISAGGDVKMYAATNISAVTVSTGKVPDGISARKSGIFIDTNVIIADNTLTFEGNSKITSGGDIDLRAENIVYTEAVSVAMPGADATSGGSPTDSIFSTITAMFTRVAKSYATDYAKGFATSAFEKIKTKIMGAKEKTDTATENGGPKTETEFAGCLNVIVYECDNKVTFNTAEKITANGRLRAQAFASGVAKSRADASLYKGATSPFNLISTGVGKISSLTKSFSDNIPKAAESITGFLKPFTIADPATQNGVALAFGVNVFLHENACEVLKGEITACGIEMKATDQRTVSNVIVKSGHVSDMNKVGIAGAIAVNVVKVDTKAVLTKGGVYTLTGGNLYLIATGNGWYITVGDASGRRTTPMKRVYGIPIPYYSYDTTTFQQAQGLGIGAGIAVGIIGVDAVAKVEDGASLNLSAGKKLGSIIISAKYVTKEYEEAAAGAAGGTAIVPVLALTVSGVYTEASLGIGDNLSALEKAIISATSSVTRNFNANASVGATKAAVGGSFGISVITDSALASLKRSLKAYGITVSSTSVSRLNGSVTASAKGAKQPDNPGGTTNPITPGGDSAQSDTEKKIEEIQNKQEIKNDNNDKGDADKFADKNGETMSKLAGDVNSNNNNKNKTESAMKNRQNASTGEETIAVAAAFALNIQNNSALSYIADGLSIISVSEDGEEGDVTLTATGDTDGVIKANASSCVPGTAAIGAAVAINMVDYDNTVYIGSSRVSGKNISVCAEIIEAKKAVLLEDIISRLIKALADSAGFEFLLNTIIGNVSDTATDLDSFIEQYKEGSISPEDRLKLRDAIAAKITGMLTGDDSDDTLDELIDSYFKSAFEKLKGQLTDVKVWINILLGKNEITDTLKGMANDAKEVASALKDYVSYYMSERFGSNDELDGVGCRISTTAIAGAGSASVNIAGAVALTILNGKTSAYISDKAVFSNETDIKAGETVTIKAETAQKVYTTATASADKDGLAIKNKDAGGPGGTTVGVGAGIAIGITNIISEAYIGKNRSIVSAALETSSIIRNDVSADSVAGEDPISGNENSNPKDIAVDASVAFNMTNYTVTVKIDAGSVVTLTGKDVIETGNTHEVTETVEGEEVTREIAEKANFVLRAYQKGVSHAQSSGFATGGKCAVGASVAANVAGSDITVSLLGKVTSAGGAYLSAETYNADEARAFAMVTGASLDRYLAKLRNIVNYIQGDHVPSGVPLSTTAIDFVKGKLSSGSGAGGGLTSKIGKAASALPLSTNLLSLLKINTGAGDSASAGNDNKVNEALNKASGAVGAAGEGLGGANNQGQSGQSVNIAAAVGVNVTAHYAKLNVSGELTAASITAEAVNRANFRTLGTGATVTGVADTNSNNISAGVAVGVNRNGGDVNITGKLTADSSSASGTTGSLTENGEIKVSARSTQNMDTTYPGLLAAQALAGAISAGSGGKVSIAGAVAVIYNESASRVNIGANAFIVADAGVDIASTEKSKLAVRAGSISVSRANAGIGASFSFIYAESEISALIDDAAHIKAKSLSLRAEKLKVDKDDYVFPLSVKNVFTWNATGKKGMININTEADSVTKILELNIGVEQSLLLFDMLNYLSSVNYYAEAIAGSVAAGTDAKFAVGGGVAMVFATNVIEAKLGGGANITLDGSDASDLTVSAKSSTQSRIISGAVAGTSGTAGVGIDIAVLYNNDTVTALIGGNAMVSGAKNIEVSAKEQTNAIVCAIAAAVAAGTSGSTNVSVGGTINAIIMQSKVSAALSDSAVIGSAEAPVSGLKVKAEEESELILVSASVSVAAGSGTAVAPGGTVAVIVTETGLIAEIGKNAAVYANGDITVEAKNKERLIDVLASVSAAAGPKGGAGIAGTVGVLISNTDIAANIGENSLLRSYAGNIAVCAKNESEQIVAMLSAAGSTGAAVGASINVNIFSNKVTANVGKKAELIAEAGSIDITAQSDNFVLLITAAGAGTPSGGPAISGSIPVVVSGSSVKAQVENEAYLKAGDTVYISADAQSEIYSVSAALSASSSGAAVGATLSTAVIENSVEALVGERVTLIGMAQFNSNVNREDRRRGVIVKANALNTIVAASVGAGISGGSAAVAGVVNTLVVQNHVTARIDNHSAVNAEVTRNTDGSISSVTAVFDTASEQSVSVEADDETHLYNIAGGVAVGSSAGVGASVATTVFLKDVTAGFGEESTTQNSGIIRSGSDIGVKAKSVSYLYNLVLSFAGGTGGAGVAFGGGVVVFEDKCTSYINGDAVSGANVLISSEAENELFNIAAAVAAGSSAAVTPVAVVTYFEGETVAKVLNASIVQAAGLVRVHALSSEFITTDGAGVAVSGSASVSGTVDVNVTKVKTKAYTGAGVSVTSAGLSIKATDEFKFIAAVATVAASGSAAVGVTAAVSVNKNEITAEIGEDNIITTLLNELLSKEDKEDEAYADVVVKASSKRDVSIYSATIAAGGEAAVGATIMVEIAGGKMDGDSKAELDKGFKPDGFMSEAAGKNNSGAAGRASAKVGEKKLSEDLRSDETKYSDTKIGSTKDGSDTFDATDGYRSDDFDSKDFDDGSHDYDDDKADNDKNHPSRGENEEFDSENNADINAAAEIAKVRPNYSPEDSTIARILKGTRVVSAGDIEITAEDGLNVDLISGTISASGTAAVGCGITVAVLYSNVAAYAEDTAVLAASGDITISAKAYSTDIPEGSDSSETEKNDYLEDAFSAKDKDGNNKEKQFDITSRTIRVLALSAGASGGASVGITVAVVTLYSNVSAFLSADVERASNIYVKASLIYPNVLTATLAAAAGIVGVGVSVSVNKFDAKTVAAINGKADIKNVAGTISVKTLEKISQAGGAASMGAGLVGVNGSVSAVINTSRSDTYIGAGVNINCPTAKIDLAANVDVKASSYIIGASVGAVSVGLNAAVAKVSPVVLTYIGVTPNDDDNSRTLEAMSLNYGSAKVIKVGSVKINNDVTSKALTKLLSIAAGAVAISGNVLLSFNDTAAVASFKNANITAENELFVGSVSQADASSEVLSVAVGAIGVGISVSYVRTKSVNEALIDTTGALVKASSITVSAGTEEIAGTEGKANKVTTSAKSLSANAGAVSVGINAAVSDNFSRNIAKITGRGTIVALGEVKADSYGVSTASAKMMGVSVGGISVLASFTIALNRSEQNSIIDAGDITASGIKANVVLNKDGECSAQADLVSGGGGVISVVVSVAVSYNRSQSLAKIQPLKLRIINSGAEAGNIKAYNESNGSAKANVTNLANFAAVSATAVFGLSFAQSVFESVVYIPNGASVECDDIEVTTKFVSFADTSVTPSAGGVDAAKISIKLNIASAVNSAVTKAGLNIAEGNILNVENVKISSTGTSYANATIDTPLVRIAKISVGANILTAILKSSHEAYIKGGGLKVNAGTVSVESELNLTDETTGAVASLGSGAKPVNISLSLVGGGVNTAVALSNAVSLAYIKNTMIDAANASLKVSSKANSYAKAYVLGDSSVGGVSIGVNVLYAYAKGEFKAYIDSENKSVKAASSNIEVIYNTAALSKTAQPNGGIKADLVGVDANVSFAKANTIARAYLKNTAYTGSGKLSVLVNGISADANATVETVTVSAGVVKIAVNVVNAYLSVKQSAYISGGDEEFALVSVESKLNENKTDKGATAYVGTSGNTDKGVTLSIIGGKVSVADAKIDAQASAYIKDAVVKTDGKITVSNKVNIRALADILTSSSVGLVNVTLAKTTASANGSYEAYVSLASGESSAGGLKIENTVKSVADAYGGPLGGVKIALAGSDVNIARATTGATVKSYVKTEKSAIFTVMGDADITSDIYQRAWAEGRTVKFSLSGINITVTVLTATLNAETLAYADCAGTFNLRNELRIRSESHYTGDSENSYGIAKAITGEAGGDDSIELSLIGATVTKATASSAAKTGAYLTGTNTGILNAEKITMDANAEARALASSISAFKLGAVLVGSVETFAYGNGITYSDIKNLKVKTSGDITINITADIKAYSESYSPGSVSLADVNAASAGANVGASVGSDFENTEILSVRNLKVLLSNSGSAEAKVAKGTNVSAISVSTSGIPTDSTYNTCINIKNSKIHALGDISFKTNDNTESFSNATGSSIALTVSADYMYGSNTQNVTNKITVTDSLISAGGGVTLRTDSLAHMEATTNANGGAGLFKGSVLKSSNYLYRTNTIMIGGKSEIIADFGNIDILANAGIGDRIVTSAVIGKASAVVSLGTVRTRTYVSSDVSVEISGTAKITDNFNTVTITANSAANSVKANGSANTKGLGVRPDVASDTDVVLTGKVSISGEKANYGGVIITGRNVYMQAYISHLYVDDYTYASGKALGGNVDAHTVTDVGMLYSTYIKNAVITGHDLTDISASVNPANRSKHIFAKASMYLGAVGDGYAQVELNKTAGYVNKLDINVDSGVYLIGADVNIKAGIIRINDLTETKKGGFIYKHTSNKNSFSVGSSVSVSSETVAYLGDAAGGIYIDIYKNASGTLSFRTVGLPKERLIYSVSGNTVNIGSIANALPGSLTLGQMLYKAITVYDQQFIPSVTITNSSGYDLCLSSITVENASYVSPRVTNIVPVVYNTNRNTPVITIEMIAKNASGVADLYLGGLIANRYGTVNILWSGVDSEQNALAGGDLTSVASRAVLTGAGVVAPLWANRLNISNANNIGKNEEPFWAYIFNTLKRGDITSASYNTITAPGSIDIVALGAANVRITPVYGLMVASLPQEADTSAFEANLDIVKLSAGGMLTAELEKPIRLYTRYGTNTVSMPVPGSVEYITTALATLVNAVGVDTEGLEKYYTGKNLADSSNMYTLPNGTIIYTDEAGSVIRIAENVSYGGKSYVVDISLSDLSYDPETGRVTLSEGVYFFIKDYTADGVTYKAGTISLDQNATFTSVVSALDANWVLNNSALSYAVYREDSVGNTTVAYYSLTYWFTNGSVKYYYINKSELNETFNNDSTTITYIIGVENADSASVKPTLHAYQVAKGGDTSTYKLYESYKYDLDSYYGDDSKRTDESGYTYYVRIWDGVEYRVVTSAIKNGIDGTYLIDNFPGLTGGGYVLYNANENLFRYYISGTYYDLSIGYNSSTGIYYLKDGASSGIAAISNIYAALGDKMFKIHRAVEECESDAVCYWTGSVNPDNKNRIYATYSSYTLYSYHYGISFVELTEAAMVIQPKSINVTGSGKDETATFYADGTKLDLVKTDIIKETTTSFNVTLSQTEIDALTDSVLRGLYTQLKGLGKMELTALNGFTYNDKAVEVLLTGYTESGKAVYKAYYGENELTAIEAESVTTESRYYYIDVRQDKNYSANGKLNAFYNAMAGKYFTFSELCSFSVAYGGYELAFCYSDSGEFEPGSLSFVGGESGLTNIPIAMLALPLSDYTDGLTEGWQLTKNIYITSSGETICYAADTAGNIVKNNNRAVYASKITAKAVSGKSVYTFDSYYLKTNDLANETAKGFSLELKSGVAVMLERLTDKVAKDIAGNYYYNTGDEQNENWTKENVTFTEETKNDSLYNVTDYAGSPDEAVDLNVSDNILTVYYLGKAVLRSDKYTELSRMRDAGSVPYTLTVFTLYNNGRAERTVDDRGNVVSLTSSGDTQKTAESENTPIGLKNISGGNVKLVLKDIGGVYYNAASAPNAAVTTLSDITIVSSLAKVGSGENPLKLSIPASGRLYLRTLEQNEDESENVVTSETYITSDDDYEFSEDITVKGAILCVTSNGGGIKGKNILVTDRSVTAGGDTAVYVGKLVLKAAKDISFNKITTEKASVSDLNALGKISFNTVITDSSEFTATAAGNIELDSITNNDGNFTAVSTAGSILFNSLASKLSHVSLSAQNNIAELNALGIRAFVSADAGDSDVNSSLTFEAVTGDIGKAELRILVSVPKGLTVRIEKVRNYFIDATDRASLESSLPYAIYAGLDENGKFTIGYYLNFSDEITTLGKVYRFDANALAELIESKTAKRDYLSEVDKAILYKLLGAMKSEELSVLFANDAESIILALKADEESLKLDPNAEAENTFNAVERIALKKEALPGGGEEVYSLVAENYRILLAKLIEAKALGNIGEVLGEILTEEELYAYYEKALYTANEESAKNTYTAPEIDRGEAFNLRVGTATGYAYVYNIGDINITQENGDILLGFIESERGDVYLNALTGSIFSGNEECDIMAENITLRAQGSIGRNGESIITEQKQVSAKRLANIDEAIYTAEELTCVGGKYNFKFIVDDALKLWFVKYVYDQKLNENGEALFDEQGKPIYETVPRVVYTDEATDKDIVTDALLTSLKVLDFDKTNLSGLGSLIISLKLYEEADKADKYYCLPVNVRYDWFAVTDYEKAGKLDAKAENGSIYISEKTGSVETVNIEAGENITITVPGEITDARDAANTKESFIAAGFVNIAAGSGSFGTSEKPYTVRAGIMMCVTVPEGIFIKASGSLNVATDNNGHIEITADDALRITNLNENTYEGNAGAESVSITNEKADIGTLAKFFKVATRAEAGGSLSLRAKNIYAEQAAGDILLGSLESENDAILTAKNGKIGSLATTGSESAAIEIAGIEESIAAFERAATLLTAEVDALRLYLARRNPEFAPYAEAVSLYRAEVARLNNILIDPSKTAEELSAAQSALVAAEANLANAEKALNEAKLSTGYTAAEASLRRAEGDLAAIKNTLTGLQRSLEEKKALYAAGSIITAVSGGNLSLNASNGIGEENAFLKVKLGGKLNAASNGRIYIAGDGDINIAQIVAESLSLKTDGNIISQSETAILANALNLRAGGDIALNTSPLNVRTKEIAAEGRNIYINSLGEGDIALGNIKAENEADIDFAGGAVSKPATSITANALNLTAGGSLNLTTAVKLISINAGRADITLNNLSTDLGITAMRGGNVAITAAGKLATDSGGRITAKNLSIVAQSDIGRSEDDVLKIYVPGRVELTSVYGIVYGRTNYYYSDYRKLSLVDEERGVIVSGELIHISAVLTTDYFEIANIMHTDGKECLACKYLKEKAPKNPLFIIALNIKLTSDAEPDFKEKLKVSIPMAKKYEGKSLVVMFCDGGKLIQIEGDVKDGYFTFETESLGEGSFVIRKKTLAEKIDDIIEPDENDPADDEEGKTALMIAGFVGITLAGIAVILVVRLEKRKKNEEESSAEK